MVLADIILEYGADVSALDRDDESTSLHQAPAKGYASESVAQVEHGHG
jgi:hypothetical protein